MSASSTKGQIRERNDVMTGTRIVSAMMMGLLLLPIAGALTAASAAPLFETQDDRAAQDDLRRLGNAEQRYWTDHGTYIIAFQELSPAPFEPTPTVYVQVEHADAKSFRAVAMPRSSTTARVFVLEAKDGHGTVIELGDDQATDYILGALKKIRADQMTKLTLAMVMTLAVLGLLIYGIILHRKIGAGRWMASPPYFLGLIPLYVTLILSTYVDAHTYIGPLVLVMAGMGALAAFVSIGWGTVALWQLVTQDEGFHLRRLALVGVLCSVLGIVSPFYTFYPNLPFIGEFTNRPDAHRLLPP